MDNLGKQSASSYGTLVLSPEHGKNRRRKEPEKKAAKGLYALGTKPFRIHKPLARHQRKRCCTFKRTAEMQHIFKDRISLHRVATSWKDSIRSRIPPIFFMYEPCIKPCILKIDELYIISCMKKICFSPGKI